MTVLGHALRLSETNAHGYVPVCECGWIGPVVSRAGWRDASDRRRYEVAELTKDRARGLHAAHLVAVDNEIARASAAALDSHAAYLAAVAPTVRRIGRWGRG